MAKKELTVTFINKNPGVWGALYSAPQQPPKVL